jgi:hypothetical protein
MDEQLASGPPTSVWLRREATARACIGRMCGGARGGGGGRAAGRAALARRPVCSLPQQPQLAS